MICGIAERRAASADIARLIVGKEKEAPEWLTELLHGWNDALVLRRAISAVASNRKELQSRFKQIQEAAELIRFEIVSPTMRGFLGPPAPGMFSDERLGETLLALEERIRNASVGEALKDNVGQTKRGRGRPDLPGNLLPDVSCALIVLETWRHVRGKAPSQGSLKAACIAEKYWRLAGGAPHVAESRGNDPLTYWKRRFIAALGRGSNSQQREIIEKARSEIRERLREQGFTNAEARSSGDNGK